MVAFKSSSFMMFALLSTIIVLSLPQVSNSFITPISSSTIKSTYHHQTVSTSSLSATTSSRRNFLEQTATATIAISTATILNPSLVYAKEPPPPITQAAVTEAFNAIRYELNDPSGVVATLTTLINNDNSFEEIMQYTKESDAYFRKAKVGRARKLLTDKEIKSGSIQLSNAITFDLIGINRASRPGQQSKEVQLKYLDELKKDIEKVLELEKTIVVEE